VIRFKHGWMRSAADLPFFWDRDRQRGAVLRREPAQRSAFRWWKRAEYLPFIMALGIGMCVNQARP